MMDFLEKAKVKKDEINRRMSLYLDHVDNDTLKGAMRHYPDAGGKRLRPILCMLTAEALGGDGEKTLPFGIAVELVHNFTLVHDDVMDKDDLRRGIKTVHNVYDTATAINAGDALFAKAFEIATRTPVDGESTRDLIEILASGVRGVAEGQQMDMAFEKLDSVSVDEYCIMIEKKTALLYMLSAKGGAIIAGASRETIEQMNEFGRLIGNGFQICDDLLDLTSDEATLGKPVGSDIRNGKRTLIVLHALENLQGPAREDLLGILGNNGASKGDIKKAIDILENAGSLQYARALAQDYADKAKDLLKTLPAGEQRELMEEFSDFMIGRKM